MDRAVVDASLEELCAEARRLRLEGHGSLVTYSPKVFIPLTTLCRDVCHYCTFARPPRRGERAFMSLDEVLAVARAGAAAGCREALFTLGDKPELRYRVARDELAELGCASTLEYLARAARLVMDETGLLPHLNPGVLTRADFELLRPVSASMGMMLETVSDRLAERGGPHFGSPDKLPAARLRTLRLAGRGARPLHHGNPDRHRRDAGGAGRGARGDPGGRAAGAGGDRPELPREARHEDGGRARRAARGAALDLRRRAGAARPADLDPGAAEPDRGLRPAARCRHRRLGRRLAGHDRPRQSGGAVAGARAGCAG